MSSDAVTPDSIYQQIAVEVGNILNSLAGESSDASLQKANEDARHKLEHFRTLLEENIQSLKNNAEWERFTIAFYGETNAGKSTVIETLRILLHESSKQRRQQAFQAFQQQHHLTDSDIEKQHQLCAEHEKQAHSLEQAIEGINLSFIDRETAFRQQLDDVQAAIITQRQQYSFWRKLLNIWAKTAEQKQHALLQTQIDSLISEKKTRSE